MSRRAETIPPDYFDALYQAEPDPWRFRTSEYEQEKYLATLAILPRFRFGAGLEVGCSIGVFTRMLAEQCDTLLAVDASTVALERAREACQDCTNVTFEHRMMPDDAPDGSFDLIVLSEVLYYLTAPDLARMAALCTDRLRPGGTMVLCHWLGETDYPLTGDAAADGFIAALGTAPTVMQSVRREQYRLDLLQGRAS